MSWIISIAVDNLKLDITKKTGLEQLINSVNLNGEVALKDKKKIYQLVKQDLINLFNAMETYANKELQSELSISKFRNFLRKPYKNKTEINNETSANISINTYLENIDKIYSNCKNAKEINEIEICQGKENSIEDIKREYVSLFQNILKKFLIEDYKNKRIHNVILQITQDYEDKELSCILISTTNWGFDRIKLKNNKLIALVSTEVKKSNEVKENLNTFKSALIEFADHYITYLK